MIIHRDREHLQVSKLSGFYSCPVVEHGGINNLAATQGAQSRKSAVLDALAGTVARPVVPRSVPA
jgi:hypothetical protein